MPESAILGTEQTGSSPQPGGFFSRLGAGLKQIMPYVTPIANRLAAAAGNYGPLELEHRQRQEDMQQQLQRSQLANQDLTRQLTQKQLDNYRTPEQIAAAQLTQAGALEDVKNLHAPGKDIITPNANGEGAGYVEDVYDPATKQRITQPKMMTTQVPNPAAAPYNEPAIAPKPNYVTDWGHQPPSVPNKIPQQSQVQAFQSKGIHYGAPVEGAGGVWTTPVYQNGVFVRNEPMNGTPGQGLESTKTGVTTIYKDDGQGHLIPVQVPSTSTTTKGTGGAAPPANSPIPGTNPVTPTASPRTNLVSPGANKWVMWQDESGRTVAGTLAQATQMGAKNPAQVPTEEIRNINDARQAVNLLDKQGKTPQSMGVIQLVDQLGKEGKLGVAASRLNSWLTGGVGTSPGDDPRIITLLDKAQLAMTLTMKAHFGASGGRSPQMLQHFLDMANAKQMDETTLGAGFRAIENYMQDRAMMPSGGPQESSAPSGGIKSFVDWNKSQPQ